MEFSSFPDWSKVGRRIGKKLRDILNPPTDDGPSEEQRRTQRLSDARKGFAYFDTFEEILQWSTQSVHARQQANTPLAARSASTLYPQKSPSTKLMLCHDYKGGYHDYESVRPGLLQDELYSCEYLQHVDSFIYFSHKLVSCPPPSWTNVLHRNGVSALGTFIIEPQLADIEQMLGLVDGEYVVAKQLARMASTYGFDGWLLNIEKEFPDHVHNLTEKMVDFIETLKRCLGPDALVVWYDALTIENEVDYQNGLSLKNAPFARAAHRLFTNYKWTPKHLSTSRAISDHFGLERSKIYFGIDVWAQNTNMPGPRRVTYPPKGGGGTNTGLAMGILAKEGFSSAVFAPAWTFEHFNTSFSCSPSGAHLCSMARSVQQSMWEGFQLPAEVGCDCRERKPHHTKCYQEQPILRHAYEFPSGSPSYLYTDFSRAFLASSGRIRSRLGSQANLPCTGPVATFDKEPVPEKHMVQALSGILADGVLYIQATIEPCLVEHAQISEPHVSLAGNGPIEVQMPLRLRLFKLDMTGDGSLYATIHCTHFAASEVLGFYSTYQRPRSEELEHEYHEGCLMKAPYISQAREVTVINLRGRSSECRLVEFGVFYQGCRPSQVSHSLIMMVESILIAPSTKVDWNFRVQDVMAVAQEMDKGAERQLTWRWEGDRGEWLPDLPWSMTTGPFSHFDIVVNARELGTAYSLDFPLRREDCEIDGEEEVNILIVGHFFGGGMVSSAPIRLPREELYHESESLEADATWCVVEAEE